MTDREQQRQRNRAVDPFLTEMVDRFNAKVERFRILQERDDWDSATSPVTEVSES